MGTAPVPSPPTRLPPTLPWHFSSQICDCEQCCHYTCSFSAKKEHKRNPNPHSLPEPELQTPSLLLPSSFSSFSSPSTSLCTSPTSTGCVPPFQLPWLEENDNSYICLWLVGLLLYSQSGSSYCSCASSYCCRCCYFCCWRCCCCSFYAPYKR